MNEKVSRTRVQLLAHCRGGVERQSNFELLRIVATLFIIISHFSAHGNFSFPIDSITVNRLYIQFIMLGNVGVNIFCLISGYYLINATKFKIGKLLKMYLQIFMYSMMISAIFILTGLETFEIKAMIKTCFPVAYSQWWFASTYIMLYLLSPFINKLLNELSKKDYQGMLLLLTICWCIIPTFFATDYQCNNLSWFIYLYILAGYIRLYSNDIRQSGRMYFILAIIMILITFTSFVVFDVLGFRFPIFAEHATFFFDDKKRLPTVLIALFIFLGFMKMDIKYNKLINVISSTTFGVYLIHEHPFVRSFLWDTVFKNSLFFESKILIPYSITVCFVVFLVSAIIELFRIYIFERKYVFLIDKLSHFIDGQIEYFMKKLNEDCDG